MANVYGQKVIFHLKSGANVLYYDSEVSEITFEADEHGYVDLGLSVKWATCNLGASTPTEYGNYYAWGETSTKNEYNQSDYAYYNRSTSKYTDIGTDISGTAYDAAHVNLGGNWRMPTYAEWQELKNTDNCSWEWTQVDGVKGYKVTSKKAGYTDKCIFLPPAGYRNGSSLYYSAQGYYWSSTLDFMGPSKGGSVHFNSSELNMSAHYRYYGLSVRPVTE